MPPADDNSPVSILGIFLPTMPEDYSYVRTWWHLALMRILAYQPTTLRQPAECMRQAKTLPMNPVMTWAIQIASLCGREIATTDAGLE